MNLHEMKLNSLFYNYNQPLHTVQCIIKFQSVSINSRLYGINFMLIKCHGIIGSEINRPLEGDGEHAKRLCIPSL